MKSAEIFSVEDMESGITRWLHSPDQILAFDIDQHRCELSKVSMGVRCIFELDSSTNTLLEPNFLLKITKSGLENFIGIPAFNPDSGYVLSHWILLSEEAKKDSHNILNIIEDLSNQTSVWKELMTEQYKQNSGIKTQSDLTKTALFPLSLSQQLRHL